MKKLPVLFLCSIIFASDTQANIPQNIALANSQILMTAQDVTNKKLSNISIINATQAPLTVYGLYIASFDRDDCSACFGSIMSGDNALGAVVEPIFFGKNQQVAIGQNYLYNMIYNGLYVVRSNGSTPCALPGCSWPGDDSSLRGWCLSLNAMSLDSSYTFSSYINPPNPPANPIPLGAAGSSLAFGYRYSLINPTTLGAGAACLGLITCDDKSLTCSAATPQSETLQSY